MLFETILDVFRSFLGLFKIGKSVGHATPNCFDTVCFCQSRIILHVILHMLVLNRVNAYFLQGFRQDQRVVIRNIILLSYADSEQSRHRYC